MLYYSSITVLVLMALGVLSVLVQENDRMSNERRRLCHASYILIALAATSEWCGVILGDVPGAPAWVIIVAKWMDYVLTPLAGGSLIWQLRMHNVVERMMNGVLGANVIFQTIAFAMGKMITLDESNHYSHSPLYKAYVLIYLIVFALIVVQLVLYGNSFRKRNRGSLYSTVALVVTSVAMQEIIRSDIRVVYLALTMAATLLYIHNGEFFQLAQDEDMDEQRRQAIRDDLTGVLNRRAYSMAIKNLAEEGMPDGFAVFSIDLNGLKETNDTLGHGAGDELLRAAADCITDAFASSSNIFRMGGDEFVVFTTTDREGAESALTALNRTSRSWRGRAGQKLSLAVGYALSAEAPGITPERLITQADEKMYHDKATHYQQTGRNRNR